MARSASHKLILGHEGKFRIYFQGSLCLCKGPFALFFGLNKTMNFFMTASQHANGENIWTGIDGNSGVNADMKELKIWDAYNVKAQTFKTAIEAACMLLRIDDTVSGIKKRQAPAATQPSSPTIEREGDADNEQMIPERR